MSLLMAALVPFFVSGNPGTSPRNTEINAPADLAYDAGHLFIVEQLGKRLTQLDLRRNVLRNISMGRAETVPHAVASDHKGGIYVADFDGGLQHLDLATGVRQVLINSTVGSLEAFDAMVVDEMGNLYLSQSRNHTVLVWSSSSKKLSILAGNGQPGFAGDDGPAEKSLLRFPEGLALTPEGNLLIADVGNCRIRRIERKSGLITTIAGTGTGAEIGACAFSEGGEQALRTQLSPRRIAVGKNGDVLIVGGGNRVWRIYVGTGLIGTVAGTGEKKSSGDGGPALKASLASPDGLAIDAEGNIYISEYVGNRIRRIDAVTGTITTVAGNGRPDRADAIL